MYMESFVNIRDMSKPSKSKILPSAKREMYEQAHRLFRCFGQSSFSWKAPSLTLYSMTNEYLSEWSRALQRRKTEFLDLFQSVMVQLSHVSQLR